MEFSKTLPRLLMSKFLRFRFLVFAQAVFCSAALAQQQTYTYQFSLDLTKVKNDMLSVELITPLTGMVGEIGQIGQPDTMIYRLPAIVPGTYRIYDFGKYIRNFHALDGSGKELNVQHTDVNSWKIGGAKALYKITYDVEDSWDSNVGSQFVFEPAGTNIEADTNFVINNHGFFGYFDKMKRLTYVVNIKHPEGFFGATGLNNVKRNGNTDTYTVPNYMELVDGPIMYNRPDTAHIFVGGADVLISVYSPRKLVSAKFVADSLRIMLDLQRQYLGGTLPVKNYAFLIYLTNKPRGYKSGLMGALEHSYSSMYTLLEQEPQFIAQTVKDVSAHEFFHIVTPLSIHSFEIGDFDYNNPKMSKHLWMYEGLTEYAAHHVQVKYGTQSLEEFLDVMRNKIIQSERFDNHLSFTAMSSGILDQYEDQFGNVYAKGALIGMCLDIRLRQLSNGNYGTQNLMHDLALKYGKDRSFIDDSLFSDIVKLTYPEIADFFARYVTGSEDLPFQEYLAAVGIIYKPRAEVENLDPLGGYRLALDKDNNVRLVAEEVDDFGREMGYRRGDILVSFNGIKITAANAWKVIDDFNKTAKAGSKIKVTVKRFDNGVYKPLKLKGKMHPVKIVRRHYLAPAPNATPEQLKLRKAWINK
jgi:predicted metalloprotease with PDZ domain